MHSTIEHLKFMNKTLLFIPMLICTMQLVIGQTPPTANVQRQKIDGVAAVIGDFVVLDSDIDRQYLILQADGKDTEGIDKCQMLGKLLEEKLYIHHAIQDSLEISTGDILAEVDMQVNSFAEQIGSMEKLVEFYKKNSEQELRTEMFEVKKNVALARKMYEAIIDPIEITPDEVSTYYKTVLQNDLPRFGTELGVAQIVVIPKVGDEQKQKVIDRLKEFKADIIENGASFRTKAVLYSEDIPSRRNGGKYTLNKTRPQMVKEFREVAFSLQEGEISDPFETDFGYHIVYLEKIRGEEYDIRHILLRPEVTQEAITEAKEKIENVRERIVNGELTFAEAALEVSDERETKFEGGKLRNPLDRSYSFELAKMEPELYAQIQNLAEGELSPVLSDQDRINAVKFKIVTVTQRVDEHDANFDRDYLKIKNLALQDKQIRAIDKWQKAKISDTYVKINGEFKDCELGSDWLLYGKK